MATPATSRELHTYLRWRNANNRHPDVIAAQRRERARVGQMGRGLERGDVADFEEDAGCSPAPIPGIDLGHIWANADAHHPAVAARRRPAQPKKTSSTT